MSTPLLILLLTVAAYAQTSLQDERDGKTYKTVQIGTQVWMAENLNYDAKGSICYDNKPENCEKYGRLYNWKAAVKACPKGWHLSRDQEWKILKGLFVGDMQKLKAKSGWNESVSIYGNGTDDYGFSALPGGTAYSAGTFYEIGMSGYWWSNDDTKYRKIMYDSWKLFDEPIVDNNRFLSVRCVKDYSDSDFDKAMYNDSDDDLDVLFFHPVSLIYGLTQSEILFYTTIKLKLSRVSYAIINPSYLDKKDYTRFGSGLGYRRYVSREDINDWRLYFQLMPGLHYLKYENAMSGPMIDVLGYAGVSKPMYGFFDVGVGYKWDYAKKDHGLAVDVNAGLSWWLALAPILAPFGLILWRFGLV